MSKVGSEIERKSNFMRTNKENRLNGQREEKNLPLVGKRLLFFFCRERMSSAGEY